MGICDHSDPDVSSYVQTHGLKAKTLQVRALSPVAAPQQ